MSPSDKCAELSKVTESSIHKKKSAKEMQLIGAERFYDIIHFTLELKPRNTVGFYISCATTSYMIQFR